MLLPLPLREGDGGRGSIRHDASAGYWHEPLRLTPSRKGRGNMLHLTPQCPSAWTISSVIFFASPNSIIVFGRKNSSLSTPA